MPQDQKSAAPGPINPYYMPIVFALSIWAWFHILSKLSTTTVEKMAAMLRGLGLEQWILFFPKNQLIYRYLETTSALQLWDRTFVYLSFSIIIFLIFIAAVIFLGNAFLRWHFNSSDRPKWVAPLNREGYIAVAVLGTISVFYAILGFSYFWSDAINIDMTPQDKVVGINSIRFMVQACTLTFAIQAIHFLIYRVILTRSLR